MQIPQKSQSYNSFNVSILHHLKPNNNYLNIFAYRPRETCETKKHQKYDCSHYHSLRF